VLVTKSDLRIFPADMSGQVTSGGAATLHDTALTIPRSGRDVVLDRFDIEAN